MDSSTVFSSSQLEHLAVVHVKGVEEKTHPKGSESFDMSILI